MEDKLTNKEKKLQGLADNYSFELNTDNLWSEVEKDLPPEKKKRRLALWWIIPIVFISMFSGALVYKTWSTDSKTNTPYVTSTTQTEKLINSENQNQVETIRNAITKTIAQPSNENQKYEVTPSDVHSEVENSKGVELNLNPASNLGVDLLEQSLKEPKAPSFNANSNTFNYEPVNTSSFKTLRKNSDSESKFILLSNPETEKESLMEVNSEEIQRTPETIYSLPLLDKRLVNAKRPYDIAFTQPIRDTYWTNYWMLSSGVNFQSPEYAFNGTEPFDLSQERYLPGVTTSLQYGWINSNGWRFGAGLTHSFIASQYRNNEQSIVQEDINGTGTLLIDENGNETPLESTLTQTTIYNNDILWHRLQHYIDLQAVLGKRIWKKGRFSLEPSFALGYNIWSKHDGYAISNSELGHIKFEDNETHPFKNQGIGTTLSLALNYDFVNWSLGLSPFRNWALSNTTVSTNNYAIKNSQYGIQLSVMYRP